MSDMRRWSGTVAFLNTETVDGRMLKMDTLPLAGVVLPLMGPAVGSECVPYPIPVGAVDDVEIEGNEVRASGWINLDQVREDLRDRLLKGESVGAAIDVSRVVTNEPPGPHIPKVFTQATLAAVAISDNPAWSGSVIRLDGPS